VIGVVGSGKNVGNFSRASFLNGSWILDDNRIEATVEITSRLYRMLFSLYMHCFLQTTWGRIVVGATILPKYSLLSITTVEIITLQKS
jgi:hypothetical protein